MEDALISAQSQWAILQSSGKQYPMENLLALWREAELAKISSTNKQQNKENKLKKLS